jgi:anti-anti-sigma factor
MTTMIASHLALLLVLSLIVVVLALLVMALAAVPVAITVGSVALALGAGAHYLVPAPGPAHLVVGLAGVRFLAAAGVGLILAAMRNEEGIRGRLHLLGVRRNRMVARVLDLTGLLPLLDVHDALDELLDHLDQD